MSLELLRHIASTDIFEYAFFPVSPPPNRQQYSSEWPPLRDFIKDRTQQNIELYFSNPDRPPLPPSFQPIATATGGLKIAPFPPRRTILPVPTSYMTVQEAADMKMVVFELLDQFESAPFTIQRVCELCLEPQKHYTSVGKYLRALEKTLLVTSTHNSFPPLTESERDTTIRTMEAIGGAPSIPQTPLFSPIPMGFLHNDARRSKSRSPPPSPLILANASEAHPDAPETKSFGLVDELDNPKPGHMSEHPVALTAVTEGQQVESLEERFVRGQSDEEMVVDNKENAPT
ncbi:hypothetical protein MIND_01043000 [Mycena indigotica]|uniref:PPP4R2-domain-containing protein n=1 Tax=Mycena indigotica TaxID=2126181 RepID=A0A8H6S901_9AGAR|nr:uncharacterized protein MIND_01043000 [Mycena indigotica]KAF7295048.1 hypothetical protein MIND_01043000 [Mycena indigotica]